MRCCSQVPVLPKCITWDVTPWLVHATATNKAARGTQGWTWPRMLQAVQHSDVSIASLLPPQQELHGTTYRETQVVTSLFSSCWEAAYLLCLQDLLSRAVRSVVSKIDEHEHN